MLYYSNTEAFTNCFWAQSLEIECNVFFMLNVESLWLFDDLIKLVCYHPHMLQDSSVVKIIIFLLDIILFWLPLDSQGFMHGQHLGLCSGQVASESGVWYFGYHPKSVQKKKLP